MDTTQEITEIRWFTKDHAFLSNFFGAKMRVNGVVFQTLEQAYHYFKTTDAEDRAKILACTTPKAAKNAGRTVKLRCSKEEWDGHVARELMEALLRQKFKQYTALMDKLVQTYPSKLIEGNTWHDNRWGTCYCNREECQGKNGKNWLGELLMKIREEEWQARQQAALQVNESIEGQPPIAVGQDDPVAAAPAAEIAVEEPPAQTAPAIEPVSTGGKPKAKKTSRKKKSPEPVVVSEMGSAAPAEQADPVVNTPFPIILVDDQADPFAEPSITDNGDEGDPFA